MARWGAGHWRHWADCFWLVVLVECGTSNAINYQGCLKPTIDGKSLGVVYGIGSTNFFVDFPMTGMIIPISRRFFSTKMAQPPIRLQMLHQNLHQLHPQLTLLTFRPLACQWSISGRCNEEPRVVISAVPCRWGAGREWQVEVNGFDTWMDWLVDRFDSYIVSYD
jgi:hypothetical protein